MISATFGILNKIHFPTFKSYALQRIFYCQEISKRKIGKVKVKKILSEPKEIKLQPIKKKRKIKKLISTTFGAPEQCITGLPVKDDLSNGHIVKQYLLRACRELDFYTRLILVPLNEKLLPDPLAPPYLQPKYTLVLELADVLVHLEWAYLGDCKFKKRPLVDHFLQTLRDSYEIIIYTAEQGRVVFSVTDVIDPKHIIAYKLVHGTTHFTGTNHTKNLNDLNRDLCKVICVDCNAKHLKYNPENLLRVKRWNGNDDDTYLLDLSMFLKTIADNDIEDVREVLKYYSKYDDPIEAFRTKQEKLIEELEEKATKTDNPFKLSSRFKPRFKL